MLKYTLLITNSFYGNANIVSALNFIDAIGIKKHKIICIFFYSDGAYNIMLSSKNNNIILNRFINIHKKYNILFKVCHKSCLNRGIKISNLETNNIFQYYGISELITYINISDRIIQF